MDPNAAWEEAVRLAMEIQSTENKRVNLAGTEIVTPALRKKCLAADQLAERIVDLAEWLKKGGFPPSNFSKK